ncbi:MAG: SDR family NAD(P)-dependent oxidoreductase [Verrucomicrobiota bacterium]
MDTNGSDKKRVLIGGISGGMGSILAKRLAACGWSVAGYARNADKLRKLKAEVEGTHTFTADARDSEAVNEVFEAAIERLGGLDGYVHCIGSILLKPAHLLKDEEWHETVNLNLNTAFYGLRAAVTHMQRNGGGSIVMMSTVAARTGIPSHEAIAAAKSGLHGLMRSAAATYANRNIRVNLVAPGLTETPLSKPVINTEQAREFSEKMHPLGRIAQPEEVVATIAHLLAPESSFITGQIYSVDGGLSTLHQRTRG